MKIQIIYHLNIRYIIVMVLLLKIKDVIVIYLHRKEMFLKQIKLNLQLKKQQNHINLKLVNYNVN
mgnify:FL=1|jgi:hypothetical protein